MILDRSYNVPGRLSYETRQSKYLKDTINLIELTSLKKIHIRLTGSINQRLIDLICFLYWKMAIELGVILTITQELMNIIKWLNI